MQERVYQVHDVDELKQCLIDVWHGFEQSAIDDAFASRLLLMSGENVSVHEFA